MEIIYNGNMFFGSLFAAEKLNIDPGTLNVIDVIGLVVMGMVILALLGYATWHYAPIFIVRSRSKRAARIKAANSIWFDTHDSILHCGNKQTTIGLKSLEYYVCKDTFAAPTRGQLDTKIMDKLDRNKVSDRAVEQAVNRLNARARAELGLQEKLFKRGKDSTSVNSMYRSRIVQQ